jgi:hypothetical protein
MRSLSFAREGVMLGKLLGHPWVEDRGRLMSLALDRELFDGRLSKRLRLAPASCEVVDN